MPSHLVHELHQISGAKNDINHAEFTGIWAESEKQENRKTEKQENIWMETADLKPKDKVLVAKADRAGNYWLPLYLHMEDTAGIMKKLLQEYLSDSFSAMCGLSDIELEKTALFLAYTHDLGKASAAFQGKILKAVPSCHQRLEKYGIKIPDLFLDGKKSPHALAGENILLFLGCPYEIAIVVGAHHGVPVEKMELSNQSLLDDDYPAYWKNYFGSKEDEAIWKNIWSDYFAFAMQKSGLQTIDELPSLHRQAQMLLTGLLIMADWIASNTKWFPLLSCDEWELDIDLEERIEYGWEAFGMPEVWQPTNQTFSEFFFRQTFGFHPRELQSDVLKTISSVNQAGIVILEAPMGCGKTEIALTASELLAAKFNRTGLFFGLPTQATANGIFQRVLDWANKQSYDMVSSIQLAHGSAMLNKNFRDLESGISESFDGEEDEGVIVHRWFCGKKQSCLADFVVGTVDQFLMAALKRKHVMLLHLGLSQKVVVIDEVHAYDAYMNCYLERALSWLGMYQVPVILLSATLPIPRRNDLIKAYLNEKKLTTDLTMTEDYPLLSWSDGRNVFQKRLSYDNTSKKIKIEKVSMKNAFHEVLVTIKEGGCVGIILNTVKRAQDMADQLRSEAVERLLLYHAQYIFPDRASKEEELLKLAGKASKENERSGLVVVGSQVLEQSLDLDFDLLVTDLCPMDLLLQRMGRLHRHTEHDRIRPPKTKQARCLLLEADDLTFEEGAKAIYGEWLLSRTRDVLPKSISLPEDISPLVQKVYSHPEPLPEEEDFYRKFLEKRKSQQNRAKGFLLKSAKSKDNIHNLLQAGISDAMAEASVRDGISSVEVLVMVKDKRGCISFLPWQNGGKKISEEDLYHADICRRIAEQRLRLPSVLCQPYLVEKTIDEIEKHSSDYIASWQKSVWLKGELVLFFNENLECEINGYCLKYNREQGLLTSKILYS